jgi:tetratricopeptide (TPR) repeat protein
VNALNGLGNYHKRRGDLDEAGEFYRRSLVLAQEIGDLRDQEQALGNLGTLYHQQGHYDLAEQAYRQARATCLAVSDEAGVALWSGNLAMVLSLLDRASEVLPLLQEQLAINRRLGHRDGEAVALMNLGTHHRDAGDLDAAEAYYHPALTAAEEVGRPALIARITGALGSVAWRRQQFEAAAEAFQRALAIYRELDEPRGEVQMLYKLAGLHYEQEAWQAAYDYAAASWHAAQRFESPYWRGRVLWLLGETAFERGDDQGAEYLAEAAVQARLADDDPRYGLSLRSILERMLAYYEGGATERAIALARTAIARWQQPDAGAMMGEAIDTFQEVVASLLAPT